VASKKQPNGLQRRPSRNGGFFSASVIDPDLIQSYLDTEFRVFGYLSLVGQISTVQFVRQHRIYLNAIANLNHQFLE
jgi:hypothetical protein